MDEDSRPSNGRRRIDAVPSAIAQAWPPGQRNHRPHWLSHLPDGWMRNLSSRELSVLHEYPKISLSIAELWAWRGDILRKHGLELPSPDVFGKDGEDHWIFQPWQITEEKRKNSAGHILSLTYFRRGRELAPSSPHIKEYLKQTSIREN